MEDNNSEELKSIIESQQEEINKLKKHARRQRWWNIFFAWSQ